MSPLILPLGAVALATWRVVALGYGVWEQLPVTLLEAVLLLVLAQLLAPRMPGASHVVWTCVAAAGYVGWLYASSSLWNGLFLGGATLIAGMVLVALTPDLDEPEALATHHFVPGLGIHPVPTVRGWRLAFLLAMVAALFIVRIARPLDKRAAAMELLATNDAYRMGQQAVKATVDANAFVFGYETVRWYVHPDHHAAARRDGQALLRSFRERIDEMELGWVEVDDTYGNWREGTEGRQVMEYAGVVTALFDDPENPPDGVVLIDPDEPWQGTRVAVGPFRVAFAPDADGALKIIELPREIPLAFERIGAPPNGS